MRLDKFSNPVFNGSDIFNALYQGNESALPRLIVDSSVEIQQLEQIAEIEFIKYDQALESLSVAEFDAVLQADWFMPDSYKNLDIRQFVLDKTTTVEQQRRVIEEFEQFEQRNMLNVLRWLVYFVDTCRSHNILWGAGRGSSVASYVLFLLGVHKIDSLKYELDWKEFLKP